MPEVVMYTTTYCGFCAQAKYLMKDKGVEFEEINLDDQPHRFEEMVQKAAGRRTTPQIFIDGRGVGGCDDLFDLDDTGELDELLARVE